MNLSEIDSPGSSNKSNINGTIVMSVDSGSASIMGSYVYNNTIAFNTFDNASDLTKVIKLYKGFTSSTYLLPLFKYNNFTINPSNDTNLYNSVYPVQVNYQQSDNKVWFYYIYQDTTTCYFKCDCYSVPDETYTNNLSKVIFE